MASETTIKQVLAVLSAEYPDDVNRLSAEQLRNRRDLFLQTFTDIDDDVLRAAALRHISESSWFPKISQLRAAAARLSAPEALDPVEAWGAVCKAILRYGYTYDGTPPFDDPLTEQVVRQFGWRNLCLSEDATADRARFLDAYARQAGRAHSRAVLPAGLQNGALAPGARRVDQITAGVVKQLGGSNGATTA